MGQSTDSTIKSTSRAYIVYDKATGEIALVHHAITFSNGLQPAEKPEAAALRLSGAPNAANYLVLDADAAEVNKLTPIQVDITNHKVIPKIKK